MGTRKWGKKNMVNPSWGNFQKPNQQMEEEPENQFSEQENEFREELPGKFEDEQKPEAEKPDWGNFQTPNTYQGEEDPTQDESSLGYIFRNITTNASRLAEQAYGRYGNLEKMGKDILTNYPLSGGVVGWALSELLGPEKWEKMVKGKSEHQMFPTSENLKEISKEITGGYTNPKTPGEEKFQGYTEDIGSTISGRTLRNPNARNIALNNFVTPIAANVTKDIVEDLGFGEKKANIAKAMVWTPLSLAFNVNASQYAANLMNQGRNGFNQNTVANIPRYQTELNRVTRNMFQGDPRSALAQQQLAGINNDIANGQTSIRDLMTRYDALNAAKRDRGLFALNVGDRRAAVNNINEVRDVVRREIQHLGQANPQALESWENGVLAFSTIHRSRALTNWIEGVSKGPYAKILTGPAAALFGVGSYTGMKNPLIAGPSSVGVPAAYKTGQTIYRMWNDRNLQNYYWNAIGAAQRENIPAFVNNYNKLNKEMEKSDSIKKKSKRKKD